jgi:hypothetical protein
LKIRYDKQEIAKANHRIEKEIRIQMNVNISELVHYITWLATDRDEVLSPIRLVKFLYLTDLYYARRNGGRTLTRWPWRFVHYGPFCGEALSAIDDALDSGMIAAISYESKFDDEPHFLYKSQIEQEPTIASMLPYYVIGPLQAAIRKWAGDTFALLDHVYFETEPMKNVRPGDSLDFASAREPGPREEVRMKRLSKQKLTEGRELLERIRQSQEECFIPEAEQLHDEVYLKALEYLNGEALELPVEGQAEIEDEIEEMD